MNKIDGAVKKEAKKLLKESNIRGFFELIFDNVYNCTFADDSQAYELETWTDGGVDMIIAIEADNALEDFKDYVNNFDIDNTIENHRLDKRYCDAFTIKQSLSDFESYLKWLKKIVTMIEQFEN